MEPSTHRGTVHGSQEMGFPKTSAAPAKAKWPGTHTNRQVLGPLLWPTVVKAVLGVGVTHGAQERHGSCGVANPR